MNKLIITIIALSFSAISNAEYMIKVPLEVSFGGSLPDGSISFNPVLTPSEPAPEPQLSHIEKCGNILKSIDSTFTRVGSTNSYESDSAYVSIFDMEGVIINSTGLQMMADKNVDTFCDVRIMDFKSSYYNAISLNSRLSTKVSYINSLSSKIVLLSNGGVGNIISLVNDLASIKSQANDNVMRNLIGSILNNPSFSGIKARAYYQNCSFHSGNIYTYCTDGNFASIFQAQSYITNNSGTIGNYYSSPSYNFEVFKNGTFD